MHSSVGPISPELVLVDPVLRVVVLSRSWEGLETSARTDAPTGVPSPIVPHRNDPDREATGPIGAAEPSAREGDETHVVIRALQWWLAALAHSAVVVAIVLGTVYVARFAF